MVYIASSESCELKRFSRCWNKVERKYIQEQQPNQFHFYNQDKDFLNRVDQSMTNYRIGIQMKTWSCSPFIWMADVSLQGALVLYRVNKDEGDWSLPFLVFQRQYCQCSFSEFFWILKGKQIILQSCRNSKYATIYLLWWHKTLPGAIRTQAYSDLFQASKMECFCINSQHLNNVNWIRKNISS